MGTVAAVKAIKTGEMVIRLVALVAHPQSKIAPKMRHLNSETAVQAMLDAMFDATFDAMFANREAQRPRHRPTG
jgi:hypothetical protein